MDRSPLLSSAAALGGIWACYQLYKLASFAYLYLIHRSSLDRYRIPDLSGPAWALVTGASDGIGRGFAEELCHRGFNVILHGRNEKKLNVVRDALLYQWPEREIRILVIDAMHEASDAAKIDAAATQLKDVNLKILINNVGGGAGMPSFVPLENRTAGQVTNFINLNAQFPSQITRALLPLLIKQKPALILNIGSGSSEIPGPYLSVYSGSKAYNKVWSRSLAAEMKAEGHNIEVICILIGMVSTAGLPKETSLWIPTSRQMAKSSLNVVGCGRYEVWPYWPHALQLKVITSLPKQVMEIVLIGTIKKEAAREAESKES